MSKTNQVNDLSLEQLGAFEIAFKMLDLAKNNTEHNSFLNAGRGNPNWIQTNSRLAYARLIQFGVQESERTIKGPDLGGYTSLDGIYERFCQFLTPEERAEDQFLLACVDYAKRHFSANPDAFVKEWTDAILGNDYPVPSRMLPYCEKIVNEYLASVLYHHTAEATGLKEKTQLFATEGAAAAMVYVFHSLKENHLIQAGDKIMINTPIFTPYIEIPELATYNLEEVYLCSKEDENWQLDPEEIRKLQNTDAKALFLVNPSNPGSMALSEEALEAIRETVEKKPDLMIITDDVYGPFAENFQSVYTVAPHNTLLIYSYSKLFGATGWRIGVIAAHEDNVFDRLIAKQSATVQAKLQKRYSSVTTRPENMKFIDRLVADSRSIGLYHTAGLSTPQQMMMSLFSMTHLINAEKEAGKDHYIEAAKQIVRQRYEDLFKGLNLDPLNQPNNARYYSLIDIYQLGEKYYGATFASWLKEHVHQIDFLVQLSKKTGVVVMDGMGFGTEPGILRVSQANLPDETYRLIAQRIQEVMADYYQQYKQETTEKGA